MSLDRNDTLLYNIKRSVEQKLKEVAEALRADLNSGYFSASPVTFYYSFARGKESGFPLFRTHFPAEGRPDDYSKRNKSIFLLSVFTDSILANETDLLRQLIKGGIKNRLDLNMDKVIVYSDYRMKTYYPNPALAQEEKTYRLKATSGWYELQEPEENVIHDQMEFEVLFK